MELALLIDEVFRIHYLPEDVSRYTILHYLVPYALAYKEHLLIYHLRNVVTQPHASLHFLGLVHEMAAYHPSVPSTNEFYLDQQLFGKVTMWSDYEIILAHLLFSEEKDARLRLLFDTRVKEYSTLQDFIKTLEPLLEKDVLLPPGARNVLKLGLLDGSSIAFRVLYRTGAHLTDTTIDEMMLTFATFVNDLPCWNHLEGFEYIVSYCLDKQSTRDMILEWLIVWPKKRASSPFTRRGLTVRQEIVLHELKEKRDSPVMKKRRLDFIMHGV